jgi:hypothetical protein
MSDYPSLGTLHIRPVVRIGRPTALHTPVRRLGALLLAGPLGRVDRTVILAVACADELRLRRTSYRPVAAPQPATIPTASDAVSVRPELPVVPARHAA